MTIASEISRLQTAKAGLKTAIEAKGVTVGDITLDAYPAKVDEIVQGGGGGTDDFVVRFWDRGVLLKTEYVDAGNDATPPTPPTYDNLTFAEWNNPYTNVQADVDADAIYNHTILQVNLNDPNWLTPKIYLNKSDTSELNIYNGTTLLATSSASGNIQLLVTLPAAGVYNIRIECTGVYSFGNGSNTTTVLAGEYIMALTCVFVGENITTINTYAFYGCTSLALTSLPAGVVTINNNAFYGCTSLALTSLPSGVTTINTSAFRGCTSLALTSLPAGVVTINTYAFYGCTSLALTSLPAGVTIINNYAFREVKRIISLTLSPDTTSIGDYSVYNCSNILDYTIDRAVPPTLVNISAFQGINAACKIYVPDANVTDYRTATNWVTYAAYIYPLSTKP